MDKHILIVEDEPFLALDLECLIGDVVDAAVVVCRFAADAMRELEAQQFDFALLDVDVLDGTTFGVAQALAAQGHRFVFVSGSDRRADAAACGALAYFSKPYHPDDIRQVVALGLAA